MEFYAEIRQSSESELNKLAESVYQKQLMRMKTLTQLLRLRQICCDPRLINASFPPINLQKSMLFVNFFTPA